MTNKIPRHVAVIMDGNGRWAKKRGLPRIHGHQVGTERVIEIIRAASKIGIRYLTLYSFSKENWQRPKAEVSFLMNLLSDYLDKKLQEIKDNNMVFNTIGDLNDIPEVIRRKIVKGQEDTRHNTGMVITFALSYSSRDELTKACREIARLAAENQLDPETITEQTIAGHLYTHNLPDPDLLIRTSGEMRISNFMLWQISYSELYVTETLWPDFTAQAFGEALDAYAQRERRFGLTEATEAAAAKGAEKSL